MLNNHSVQHWSFICFFNIQCNLVQCGDIFISGDITEGALDLATLFDHSLLRYAASKIK